MGDYVLLAISCVLVNNILLSQYLGNCPFLGTSKKMVTAFGMAMAVVFALVLFAGVRERILLARVPKPLQDTSIGLVTAGFLSLSFFAFKGMV